MQRFRRQPHGKFQSPREGKIGIHAEGAEELFNAWDPTSHPLKPRRRCVAGIRRFATGLDRHAFPVRFSIDNFFEF
jgi:hypothetical protein